MKKLNFLIALIFSIKALNAQADKLCRIEGEVKGLPDNTVFYLIHADKSGGADTVSQVISIDQKFAVEGVFDLSGEFYYLKMDTGIVKLAAGKNSYVTLMMDSRTIKVNSNMEDWPKAEVIGSKATNEYHIFADENSKVFIKYVKNSPLDRDSVATYAKKYKEFLVGYIEKNLNSAIAPYLISRSYSSYIDFNEMQMLYDKLSRSIRSSFYGVKLAQRIKVAKLRLDVGVGKIIPDFSVETKEGKMKSIREIAKRSNYTLIDYWAWWCKPCRADVPNMKNVYSAFSQAGFNIVSISTDLNKEKWKKAIKEDETKWTHVLDIDKTSEFLFGITAIPGYILIDKEGKILKYDALSSVFETSTGKTYVFADKKIKNLRSDLYNTIAELLGPADNKPTNPTNSQ